MSDAEHRIDPVARLLAGSDALYEDIEQALSSFAMDEANVRDLAALALTQMAFEHGVALRGLLGSGLTTSGIALLRLQFEALLRAAWCLHAATDVHVERLTAPLTPEGEQGAKNLPSAKKMIESLERLGPRGSGPMFRRFHDRLSHGLNSFVHAGIHPLHRQFSSYPDRLLCDVVKNSNAVAMLAVIVMAELADDGTPLVAALRELHERHADALPPLEPLPQSTTTAGKEAKDADARNVRDE